LGDHLFQSDPDLDIVDDLSQKAGVELYSFETEEEEARALKTLNDGKFNELFDVIMAEK
jgi:hypothetical protein